MKKTRTKQIVRVVLALAIGSLTGVSEVAIAGGSAIPTNLVPKIVDLHAPNNATLAVTVWIPKASSATPNARKPGTQGTTRVIELPASNGGGRSITVWIDDCKSREHPRKPSST
jgi:hypothetical protein